jgi:hypothetical protein
MTVDMEQLLDELRGIRKHLEGLHSAADRYLYKQVFDRLDGSRNLLEMHQLEFDKQARRWKVLQRMTQEEFDEFSLQVRERFGQKNAT